MAARTHLKVDWLRDMVFSFFTGLWRSVRNFSTSRRRNVCKKAWTTETGQLSVFLGLPIMTSNPLIAFSSYRSLRCFTRLVNCVLRWSLMSRSGRFTIRIDSLYENRFTGPNRKFETRHISIHFALFWIWKTENSPALNLWLVLVDWLCKWKEIFSFVFLFAKASLLLNFKTWIINSILYIYIRPKLLWLLSC